MLTKEKRTSKPNQHPPAMRKYIAVLIVSLTVYAAPLQAQTSAMADSSLSLKHPDKYIDAVADKAKSIEKKLNKKSEKALAQLKKEEDKIINKIAKADSALGKQLREQAKARYKELEDKLKNPGKLTQYLSGLDSSSTALNFLQQTPAFATAYAKASAVKKASADKIKDAIAKPMP